MKILIANRGEISVRIIRALKKMNYQSVVVYTKADVESLHVKLADISVCIGREDQPYAYLDKVKIITVAIEMGVDAIHPGYGFFSEDYEFVKMCEDLQIKFLGPKSSIIKLMGDKINALNTVQEYGLPVLPSIKESIKSLKELHQYSEEIGYPLILKAAGGGGGKGLRVVHNKNDLEKSYATVLKEIPGTSTRVFVEKYLTNTKHVEVQVLSDSFGNAIHLGTRDCSIQRNNQKLIEESPAIVDSDELEVILNKCCEISKKIGYVGAGTFEFLYSKGHFYFLEMNTRIQVEHTISEVITNTDIVYEQIKICLGETLSLTQDEIEFTGHAIEVRVNAEDGINNFCPSPGKITSFHLPGGANVRNDFSIYSNSIISPFYDSMVGKIICWGNTRDEAISNMKIALEELNIEGIKTTKELSSLIMDEEIFLKNEHLTSYFQENYEKLIKGDGKY